MKLKRTTMGLLAGIAGTCMGAADLHAVMNRLPVDGFAATVNERIITIGDVYMSISEAEQRLRIMYGGAELRARSQELFLSGLERLIDQALILEEFENQKVVFPERLVDDHINDVVFTRYNNDRAALMAALAEEQITLDEWRETIRNQIIVRMMRSREVGERVIVSPLQVRQAYEARQDRYVEHEQVRLRMIFIKASEHPERDREKMILARGTILAGGDFADAAKELSEDPSDANGGDWGWINPAQLREELKNAVGGIPPGEISDIIETSEGFFLLKIEERRDTSTRSFEEVRQEIENELREEMTELLYRNWVERLRNKYSVIYHIPVPPTSPAP